MSSNLMIVESPSKAKTIQKYLGKNFEVMSSFGHIVDLPKKKMGIDICNNFTPIYEISSNKKEIVKKLKERAEKSDYVWLASDEDREGEAIAWHLFNQLELKKEKTKRIVFHEITEQAIKQAIENPRFINENLVNAQQARRVLDRIVGFEISPVLWKKIKTGLSAGRVQSVALRLIVEREKEIKKFIPTLSYKISGLFVSVKNEKLLVNLEIDLSNEKQVLDFLEKCKNQLFKISSINKKSIKRSPPPPFITSTLQQEASLKLNMNVSKTMKIAQQLYEKGFITYMRTDSINLSNYALSNVKKVIENQFGLEYYYYRQYQTKSKNIQEAHEAIRPTNLSIFEITGNHDQIHLYKLIWKRTLASQMRDANIEKVNIVITGEKIKEKFLSTGETILFSGFLKLYQSQEGGNDTNLPKKIEVGQTLNNLYIQATEYFSKPLPRYTEASLVKKLEKLGIGRPSTYAPTISTIQQRKYVVKNNCKGQEKKYNRIILQNNIIQRKILMKLSEIDNNKLVPTDIGIISSDFLIKNFKNILEYNFTAKVEEEFDQIALGNQPWTNMLNSFYPTFHSNIESVKEHAERATGHRILGIDPKTKKNVHVKIGKYGSFVQIGEINEEEKPRFASLLKNQEVLTITLEEALNLFKLPRTLGVYQNKKIEVNNGKFGPYIKYKNKFYSLPVNFSPTQITLKESIKIIVDKLQSDRPIHIYEDHYVTKGRGPYGPFIKWNETFIRIPNNYNFDNLSIQDIENLIEEKKKKDINKLIKNWKEEGIKLEKGRWGTSVIKKGNIKINLPKNINPNSLTLIDIQKIIDNQ